MKSLQRGLGFEVFGEGLAGLGAFGQGITFLDEIVDAHILVIRPLGARRRQTEERGGKDQRRQQFHDGHITEDPCALAILCWVEFRLDMDSEFEFASPSLISMG